MHITFGTLIWRVRVAWLCGVVMFLEGYDITSVGYAVPSLVDVWRVPSPGFTQALTAGNVGLLLGSLCFGLMGDRLGGNLFWLRLCLSERRA